MFHLNRIDGCIMIDVGWYPDHDLENGLYRGLVVRGDVWDNPLEVFTSRNTENMHWWVNLMMDRYDDNQPM